ncbi:MAG: hypothetical protein CVU56_00470 [Deltaproteobacteria bacterium HGW-Deltaproteobacteria-14]|jgi:glutamate dehydrogenase/leucine dehydrogenase|nr:MAG: hypothetical protein CVU56_00470 [Deltaproteobacteria bacterium HGW-Deltaproteobacteria-14]
MPATHPLVTRSPQALVETLRGLGLRRFCLVPDPATGALVASHPALQPLADFVAAAGRDFEGHEGLFFQISERHDTLQGAFVHRTCRGQAAGGVRYWAYDTVEDYLRDGLRLAMGMTHKNALAGLWWGGGKGVMARNPAVDRDDPGVRADLYRDYGALMTSIRGCYVTAEDVGTCVTDMDHIFERTRFTTCIAPALGGSGNPSVPTARGVVAGMRAALEHLGAGTLEGKTVAVQGLGNVGWPLVGMLLDAGVARIIGCDVDEGRVASARDRFAGRPFEATLIARDDESWLATDCDVLAPCATGAVLNPRTIPRLRARVVCGAANNQLEDPERDDRALHERGILYVPDFLTNRMGIVTCADEQAGYVPGDPLIERHLGRDWEHGIHRAALRVFAESSATGRPPGTTARAQADALSREPHPIFGHRGPAIIRGLVDDGWAG